MSKLLKDLRRRIGGWHSRTLPYLLPVVPRAIWRLLPGSSVTLGPPRRWASWNSYVRAPNVGWVAILPSQSGDYPVPFWPVDGTTPFKMGRTFRWPEQGVALLKNARVISADGWCVAGRDTFIGDFCFGGNIRSSSVYALKRQRPPHLLPGVTLNLCSQHAARNFCHWAMDAVPRLELVARAGISRDSIDHILVPRLGGTTADWIMARLGLATDKVIHPGERDQFRCEVLMQPSYPGQVESYPPWAVEFYRRNFSSPHVLTGGRRIYFPRHGKRGLVNEADVERELFNLGFESFEPAGQTDLHTKLADVTHVVGVHGAAMANLVFCRPGTRVLELLPSDMPWRYFYSLCSSGGMPYGVIMGKSLRERRSRVQKATHAPFHVPIDELRAGLAALLATAAR